MSNNEPFWATCFMFSKYYRTLHSGDQHRQQTVFFKDFFFVFVSICLVCLNVRCELCCRIKTQESSNWCMKMINSKNQVVRGNSVRVWVKTASLSIMITSPCFLGPGCSVVVIRNVFFYLSSHLSVFLAFWKYMLDFYDFLHVARNL